MTSKRPFFLNRLIEGILGVALCCCLTTGCGKVTYTCTSCHTDKDTLVKVADPVEYPISTGEG